MATTIIILLIVITSAWIVNCLMTASYVACVPIEYRTCIDGVSDQDGHEPNEESDYISSEITIKGSRFLMVDYYCTDFGGMNVKHTGYVKNNIVYFDDKAMFKLRERHGDIMCSCLNGNSFVLYRE